MGNRLECPSRLSWKFEFLLGLLTADDEDHFHRAAFSISSPTKTNQLNLMDEQRPIYLVTLRESLVRAFITRPTHGA